jgi:hypothetical protein
MLQKPKVAHLTILPPFILADWHLIVVTPDFTYSAGQEFVGKPRDVCEKHAIEFCINPRSSFKKTARFTKQRAFAWFVISVATLSHLGYSCAGIAGPRWLRVATYNKIAKCGAGDSLRSHPPRAAQRLSLASPCEDPLSAGLTPIEP